MSGIAEKTKQTEEVEEKEKKEEKDFSAGGIYDDMSPLLYSMEALGLLLQSSDLRGFEGDEEVNINLRWGVSKIIEMLVEKQKELLETHVDQYRDSDIHLLKDAARRYKYIDQQGFHYSAKFNIDYLKDAIKNLDIVVERNGNLAELSEELKEKCTNYIGRLGGGGIEKKKNTKKQKEKGGKGNG